MIAIGFLFLQCKLFLAGASTTKSYTKGNSFAAQNHDKCIFKLNAKLKLFFAMQLHYKRISISEDTTAEYQKNI